MIRFNLMLFSHRQKGKIHKLTVPIDEDRDYFGHRNLCKRSFLARVTDDHSWFQIGTLFARFSHQSITFSGFHCFHFHCVLFWSFPFKPPLRKSKTLTCGRVRLGLLTRKGKEGNDQKKYTMEVKTVKARKSDGLV